jgi:hypothetical protein
MLLVALSALAAAQVGPPAPRDIGLRGLSRLVPKRFVSRLLPGRSPLAGPQNWIQCYAESSHPLTDYENWGRCCGLFPKEGPCSGYAGACEAFFNDGVKSFIWGGHDKELCSAYCDNMHRRGSWCPLSKGAIAGISVAVVVVVVAIVISIVYCFCCRNKGYTGVK